MPLDTAQPPFVHPACEKRWGGLNTAHCDTCHETFSGITTFDKHRTGGRCRAPESIGLVRSKRAYPCWSVPGDDQWWEV